MTGCSELLDLASDLLDVAQGFASDKAGAKHISPGRQQVEVPVIKIALFVL